MLEDCRALAQAGAGVIGIHEDRRTARLSVLALAGLIAESCSAEPLAHYTCRDRSLFGMISDLLGAAASGVRNVLLLTGDPPGAAPYPDYRSVVDVDSIGLTNVVTAMNRGVDPSGNDIGPPPGFVAGVALRQGTRDPAREVGRFHWKVDAGARFAVTQPVFDADHLLEFLAGIWDGDRGPAPGMAMAAPDPGSPWWPRSSRSGRSATRTFSRTRCRAWCCRTGWWSGCGGRRPAVRITPPRKGSRSRGRRWRRWRAKWRAWRSPRTGDRGWRRR